MNKKITFMTQEERGEFLSAEIHPKLKSILDDLKALVEKYDEQEDKENV